MFTEVFEQGAMMQLLADLLKLPDIPRIMTTSKQVHTDLGHCNAARYGSPHDPRTIPTWSEWIAFSRRLLERRAALIHAGTW